MIAKPLQKAIAIGMVAAIAIAGTKGLAYAWTGSQAVFADWIESLVHIWVTLLVCLSVWYSSRPPDHEHRYGHGKITYFTAALEGIIIICAGLATFASAAYSWWHGFQIGHFGLGIILECAMVVVNGMVGRYLVNVGNASHNLALSANGQHVLADMWTTLGIVVSLLCTWLTGWQWVDVTVASCVSVNIIWTGAGLCRNAYEGLMERIDEGTHDIISKVLDRAVKEHFLDDYHQLRHRRVNDCIWIEVHMLFDGSLALQEVHRRATAVEMQLIECFRNDKVYVTSHLEPLSHNESHPSAHPDHLNKDQL